MGSDLPDVSQIDRLELFADDYTPVAVIENRDGQRLSLQIYYHAARTFGGIGPKAANSALLRYGEHVADARRNPGKHPNIDRLFDIIINDRFLSVHAVAAGERGSDTRKGS
ncbi:hypothetical protein TVNIR_0468 [Thioalkalivibrio nitratireducens DSM 14787]|uniref:DUF2322 family protein n=1 Tax=Thioalkalivibrio nitratireducens (strain DSM 14787 / UNIQEM 213 / ALEN2) TaxID=1255043 RepID=L0DT55_THIND|nr:DUF2322 family protein [Thioalkalivibrio nitratireducens]AGA32170.1 hypothetical protein TVNIR_0468 [Thioalkalivibrio nitratireducens DSM 14787]